MMGEIEAYASATSVFPGERIDFNVRIEPPHYACSIRIYRVGRGEVLFREGGVGAFPYATPDNAYEAGCGWPVAYSLTVPDSWPGGAYVARFASLVLPFAAPPAEVLFVVKAAAPGTNSKILLQLCVTTYQAYNRWGGKSLYDLREPGGEVNQTQVSFSRPTSLELFRTWELPFIAWIEDNGFEVEYVTSIDLHADPTLLENYRLLLSVGHDEYWSKEMRDQVEAYIGNGGNVAFFSGNVCWWQVRFEDGNRTMVCYHEADLDPMTSVDPSRVTVLWREWPVNRPENRMTGVSFVNGAGWWNGSAGPRPAVDYVVRFARHWVFDTTGLNDGDGFGADVPVVGYETDAAEFCEDENGIPHATGRDGTPLNFLVLATADCTNWGPGGQAGMATMGIFRNRGTVFTAATTDWSLGLRGDWNAVQQITQNVLRRLSCPCPPSPDIANAGFETWTRDDVPDHWHLEGEGRGVQAHWQAAMSGRLGLVVDASAGQTWISQGFDCEGKTYYRVGCWAWANRPGATIRLQSTVSWRDFALAEHPGSGDWQYLCAVGMLDDEGPLVPARVKIQVAAGLTALFDNVSVSAL